MSDPGRSAAAGGTSDGSVRGAASDLSRPAQVHESSPVGIVLAAGAGTRFGGPKALARDGVGVPWVVRVAGALRDGGCSTVIVVLGAQGVDAEPLVPKEAAAVHAEDWAEGLSASVRVGLGAAAKTGAATAVITTVDVPDLPASAVRRVLDAGAAGTAGVAAALVQATYGSRPGHPVLIGRTHWEQLAATLTGDRGARSYLAARGALEIECGDLWSGADIDTP